MSDKIETWGQETLRLLNEGEHGEALKMFQQKHGMVSRFKCKECGHISDTSMGYVCEECCGGVEVVTVQIKPCKDCGCPVNAKINRTKPTADELVARLEELGLDWDLGHNRRLIEARVWRWPDVIGRYRPSAVEPLADMLMKAMDDAGIEI